jgi:hypothetical protein
MRKYLDSNVPDRVYQAWMDFLDLKTEDEILKQTIEWFDSSLWEPVRWSNELKTLFFLPQKSSAIAPYSDDKIVLLNCFSNWMKKELEERKFSAAFFKWNHSK